MFHWLKKLFTAAPATSPAAVPAAASPAAQPERPLEVMDVVDQFLQQNPQRTPLATLALIRAGATRLQDCDQVLQACDKIAEHGYQYPLSPTVQSEVPRSRLLEFLRWQLATGVEKQDYANEHAVRALIQRFLHQPRD